VFLIEAGGELGFETLNTTFTTVEVVLKTFRRRLLTTDALAFAMLPPVLRALRRHHDFSPEDSMACVSKVLRRHVDAADFKRLLTTLPAEAALFWGLPQEESSASGGEPQSWRS